MKEKQKNLISRPPVVVLLGHIDHGKSSLLETIKDLKITEKESGGITQHIGAYEIEHEGEKITFIDTPGHEAFSAMRSRGAKVADIAILVVAADEGVKPQTKEAILHIKKTGIPMIVAINKMDKPAADSKRVKKDLAQNDVLVEELQGEVPAVEVSAKTKTGIEDLLKLILLVAEMEDLKGNPLKPAQGTIIEAYLDTMRGPTSTLILENGILHIGDIVGTPSTFGRIKRLENFQGISLKEAYLSMPVVVLGFKDVPGIGEKFKVYYNLGAAETHVRKPEKREKAFFVEPGKKVLNLILKTDVLGSIEPVEQVLNSLSQEKVVLRVLKTGVGDVNLSDIKLAQSSKVLILGFRVKTSNQIWNLGKKQGVRILNFDLIYDLVEGMRKAMERTLEPETVRVGLGSVEVLVIFKSEKKRQIVGGKVSEGEFQKGARLEILRKKEVVGRGKIISLQRNKRDIRKAKKGDEIGILYEGEVKIEEGDILQIYREEKKAAKL